MDEKRLNLDGSMTHQMATPYGRATLSIWMSRNAMGRVDVRVHKDVEQQGVTTGHLVVKTSYERTISGKNDEWKPETGTANRRTPAHWYGSVAKKDRHNVIVVLDALVLSWLKDHETDLQSVKVADLRARAWHTQNMVNSYADTARRLAAEADAVELGALRQEARQVA